MRFILFFIFLFFFFCAFFVLAQLCTRRLAPVMQPPPRLSTHSPHPLPCPPCISIFLVLLGAFGVGLERSGEEEVWLIIGCGAVCACCAAQRPLFLPACLLPLLSSLFFVFSVSLLLVLLRVTSLPPCVHICECGHVGLHAPTTALAHRPYRPRPVLLLLYVHRVVASCLLFPHVLWRVHHRAASPCRLAQLCCWHAQPHVGERSAAITCGIHIQC